MNAPAQPRTDILREEGNLLLTRRITQEGQQQLALVCIVDQRSLGTFARFDHEFSLRAQLREDFAVLPLALMQEQGQASLLLRDPGGALMSQLMGRPWELGAFLRSARGLARSLARMHERGIVHKDIKPANTFVDIATGDSWLTNFGGATLTPCERQAPLPPHAIAGTLAYIAPEQTGWMNRSVDSRSDLYAYGVTLYEMLTGELPFTGRDAMGWVHCHVAKRPVPPSERAQGIPAQIDAIVLRLLAKNAEDRYQTAAGVGTDLERCLVEWQATGEISEFALGTRDVSPRLRIPERLYGRDREIDCLTAAFARVAADNGPSQVVFLSGPSGIGKSSLVNELRRVLVPSGRFATGKSNAQDRQLPYASLAQAFQDLVRPILSCSEDELQRWRGLLTRALGPNAALLAEVIPELEVVFGRQPAPEPLTPEATKSRFQMALQVFLGVFATAQSPLVLFLDDLQWADDDTLDLVVHLFTLRRVPHLLLVCAFRDNEMGAAHGLPAALAALRAASTEMREIGLAPIDIECTAQLLADALQVRTNDLKGLAELVHDKTEGNPFFSIQFLVALAETGQLAFDTLHSTWRFDVERIRSASFAHSVADIAVAKLNRLPEPTRHALQRLACFGDRADASTLSLTLGIPEAVVHEALWEAVRTNIISRTGNLYVFAHDRLQDVALTLVAEPERAAIHLNIGRVLLAHASPELLAETVCEIVSQLNRGIQFVAQPDERQLIARLNLKAGLRAKQAGAYSTALAYFLVGESLLEPDRWIEQPKLAFDLTLQCAEGEFLTGDLNGAEAKLIGLDQRAGNKVDRSSVTCLQMSVYTMQGRSADAVGVCLDFLRPDGVAWSTHPTQTEVLAEIEAMWARLGTRPIESLVDLPISHDADLRATLDVLLAAVPPASYIDEHLLLLVALRIANLSLEHGNSDASCLGYATLGMNLAPRFSDYQSAFRFGRVGIELVEKRGLDRFKARVFSFAAIIAPWAAPLRSARALLKRSEQAANAMGDLAFAAYCCDASVTNFLAAGDPLPTIEQAAEAGLAFVRQIHFGLVADVIATQLALIRMLRGSTPDFGSLNNQEFEEVEFESRLTADSGRAKATCWYWIRKLQARFHAYDYESAVDAAAKAEALLWTSNSFFEVAEYHFFAALACAARADDAEPAERATLLLAVRRHEAQLGLWAGSCPENFGSRRELVLGELARLDGEELRAEMHYERAVQLAADQGFVHHAAIACEIAAHFYARRGLERSARAYREDASLGYARWGADGKVRQLARIHRHLRREHDRGHLESIDAPLERLDIAAVVRMSQVVSAEIVLEKLVDTLMRHAVEHAGAQRALLILAKPGPLMIEAEAVTGQEAIEVRSVRRPPTPLDLPGTVLHFVLHTQEDVILDDAASTSRFSGDEYLMRKGARSLLCLPLVKQTELVGVLYLENNLASHAFTPARVEISRILVLQAASSLENARLYAELQKENDERRRSQDALQAAQSELARVSRVTTLGELTASIAHEVNQPLAAVVANAFACVNWLEAEQPPIDNIKRALLEILDDGERAGQVLRRIRALLSRTAVERVPCNLAEAVGGVLHLVKPELSRHAVQLHASLSPDLPPVLADAVELQQVVLNLMLNAAEASRDVPPDRRRIVVRAFAEQREGQCWVRVEVEDSGVGFQASGQSQIFDAFYTTKATGLGMGLSISRSIIDRHGGSLWASQNAEQGATFAFALPVVGFVGA